MKIATTSAPLLGFLGLRTLLSGHPSGARPGAARATGTHPASGPFGPGPAGRSVEAFADLLLLRADDQTPAATKGKKRAAEAAEPRLDSLPSQGLGPESLWSPPLAGAAAAGVAPAASAEAGARASLEDLLPALVKRIAWSGDSRRGTMRLELGAGALAGATLVVHAEEGTVRVQLSAPSGADPAEWRARIQERLAARGIAVDGIEVE